MQLFTCCVYFSIDVLAVRQRVHRVCLLHVFYYRMSLLESVFCQQRTRWKINGTWRTSTTTKSACTSCLWMVTLTTPWHWWRTLQASPSWRRATMANTCSLQAARILAYICGTSTWSEFSERITPIAKILPCFDSAMTHCIVFSTYNRETCVCLYVHVYMLI